MSLRRRYIATCDEAGCTTELVFRDLISGGDVWDYGVMLADAGWNCGPNRKVTYCPSHYDRGEPSEYDRWVSSGACQGVGDDTASRAGEVANGA